MNFRSIFITTSLLALSLSSLSAQAELYKWVSADGKVTYSDVPPPANAKRLTTKISDSEGADNSNLPSELAGAVKLNPVTLYTSPDCPACNEGRALLKGYGIPFTEKSVSSNEDIQKLKQISGENTLPVLIIRNTKFRGLVSSEWRNALTKAGYPQVNKLPKDYTFAAAEPAAPKQVTPTAPPPAPPPPASDEPKIRF